VTKADFNSYGSRRGNHEVMMRGTFANKRIKNQLAPGTEGGWTTDFTDGKVKYVYEASENYRKAGIPLVVLAGKDYGMGSSRDWAASNHDYCDDNSTPEQRSASSFGCRQHRLHVSISRFFLRHFVPGLFTSQPCAFARDRSEKKSEFRNRESKTRHLPRTILHLLTEGNRRNGVFNLSLLSPFPHVKKIRISKDTSRSETANLRDNTPTLAIRHLSTGGHRGNRAFKETLR
jgi:hypothetical protein